MGNIQHQDLELWVERLRYNWLETMPSAQRRSFWAVKRDGRYSLADDDARGGLHLATIGTAHSWRWLRLRGRGCRGGAARGQRLIEVFKQSDRNRAAALLQCRLAGNVLR
jgi:hypothetical protein